jgi:hypothetical protein
LETATGQTNKYAKIIGVHVGLDGKVRSADAEYKVPRESRFRVTTKPIHKLVLVVPVEEQTMEETEDEQRNGEEADGDSNSGEEVRGEKLGQEDSVQIGPNQTTPDKDELRKIDRGGMPGRRRGLRRAKRVYQSPAGLT